MGHSKTRVLARAHPWRRVPAGWHERQPRAGEGWLVLVVSKVCARRYGAGRVGEGSTRGEERLVGRSAAGAAVGMAEEEPLARAENALLYNCFTTAT
jgi:hypothetical protein